MLRRKLKGILLEKRLKAQGRMRPVFGWAGADLQALDGRQGNTGGLHRSWGGKRKGRIWKCKRKGKKKGGGWMGGGTERRREEEEELSLQLPIYLSHLRPTLPPHLMCVSCCFVAVTHESTQPVHLSALVPTVRQGGVMAHVVVLLR